MRSRMRRADQGVAGVSARIISTDTLPQATTQMQAME